MFSRPSPLSAVVLLQKKSRLMESDGPEITYVEYAYAYGKKLFTAKIDTSF